MTYILKTNQQSKWYRPYYLPEQVGYVSEIVFYNESGAVLDIKRGWIDMSQRGDLAKLVLPNIPKKVNAVKYDRDFCYVIRDRRDIHSTERTYILYIPAAGLEIIKTGEELLSEYYYEENYIKKAYFKYNDSPECVAASGIRKEVSEERKAIFERVKDVLSDKGISISDWETDQLLKHGLIDLRAIERKEKE